VVCDSGYDASLGHSPTVKRDDGSTRRPASILAPGRATAAPLEGAVAARRA